MDPQQDVSKVPQALPATGELAQTAAQLAVSAPSEAASAGMPPPGSQLTPIIANDNDLIEEEWVAIAKRIIIENKNDPYNLNKAITLLRADYMKKRYNKDIKLAE
jgi:hypothetical protein